MRISTLKRRRGQALLEFALLLPLLLILSMVIVQYGILLSARQSLYHVSRNVGRFTAVNALKPNIDGPIRAYAINVGASFRLTLTNPNITFHTYQNNYVANSPTPPPVSPQNTVSITTNRVVQTPLIVRIRYNTNQKLFLPSTFLGVRVFSEDMIVDNIVMME